MAKLEEIEKELYEKEKEVQERLEQRSKSRVFFPRTKNNVPNIWRAQHPSPGGEAPWVRHPWRYFFGGVTLVLIILTGIFVFFYLRSQGQEARLEIQAGDTVVSGGIMTIPILYKNISRSTLGEGQITIVLPPGAFVHEEGRDVPAPPRISRKVEDLQPGSQGVIEIAIRLFGHENENQTIEAIYFYHPENVSAQFSVRGQKTIKIVKVPLALSWDVPHTLSRGQDFVIKVHYLLDNSLPFQDMALKMEYPGGFKFVSAEPKPSVGDTIWQIGTLQSGQEGIITIHGTVSGEGGEVKAFRSSLGTFDATTKEWKTFSESSKEIAIAVTPLSIQGSLEDARGGVVQPGSTLRFILRYRNNTSSVLKNITVKALTEGSILNRLTLEPEDNGVVDSKTGAVVWGPGNTSDLREIGPDQSGELAFEVTLKDPPPVTNNKDKNLTVVLRSSILAATIPEELKGTDLSAEDVISLKVASKFVFSAKALHGGSPIPVSGVFPPQVGEKTTYTILWELKNFTSDIVNSQIVAALPPNVTWEGVTRTNGTLMTYDSAASRVRWDVGMLPAGTGVLTPTLTGAFQVSITPASVDRGKTMILVNEAEFTGTDSFADIPVWQKINLINTVLSFDPTAKSGDSTVR